MASLDWAKTTARRAEKPLSLGFGASYIRYFTVTIYWPSWWLTKRFGIKINTWIIFMTINKWFLNMLINKLFLIMMIDNWIDCFQHNILLIAFHSHPMVLILCYCRHHDWYHKWCQIQSHLMTGPMLMSTLYVSQMASPWLTGFCTVGSGQPSCTKLVTFITVTSYCERCRYHRRLDCLLNRLLMCKSKKISKLRIPGP